MFHCYNFFKIKKTWFQRNIDPLLYSGFWKIKNQKNQQNDKKCQQIHKKSTKSIKKSTKSIKKSTKSTRKPTISIFCSTYWVVVSIQSSSR